MRLSLIIISTQIQAIWNLKSCKQMRAKVVKIGIKSSITIKYMYQYWANFLFNIYSYTIFTSSKEISWWRNIPKKVKKIRGSKREEVKIPIFILWLLLSSTCTTACLSALYVTCNSEWLYNLVPILCIYSQASVKNAPSNIHIINEIIFNGRGKSRWKVCEFGIINFRQTKNFDVVLCSGWSMCDIDMTLSSIWWLMTSGSVLWFLVFLACLLVLLRWLELLLELFLRSLTPDLCGCFMSHSWSFMWLTLLQDEIQVRLITQHNCSQVFCLVINIKIQTLEHSTCI